MNNSCDVPLHAKAKEAFSSGLFSGLSSFEELEKRIAELDGDKKKGDTFEVFSEAYLATQRKHDSKKVWPLNATPLEVLTRLGLSGQDYGIDGVFQTVLNRYNAYQVKFRTGRTPLTWRELSTFMGLADSPHIQSRILLTNCDDLPPVLNERQGFFCIRGSDLDRMEPRDFQAIEAWLAHCAFEAPKKEPQPHQIEALNALLPALEKHDRVTAIMACGTGKTLVALWTAERLRASTILILLPSLALLRQTLHEWLRETRLLNLAYLCVCSDQTVKDGIDAPITLQSELDFEVSTNPQNVRKFLDLEFNGTKVVFSTYQSAAVVREAMKPEEVFNLGIFDEAHKTAGREGRNYGLALEDANLRIQKRLFITATPRHYNPHQRTLEIEQRAVFSMDNEEIYGPQAYRLTFNQAAARGIICKYKVIISVITSEIVTNDLLSRGEVMVNDDAVFARQVANQIALRDAIIKYGAKKIFTFHKTVKSAASFVAVGAEGLQTHLPEFKCYHVSGEMATARRERSMRAFREAPNAVMSNARCLTEGVDVPAVDMVAFLSPRRSQVDIVQATGRAMRQSPSTGKTVGYVLMPIYVETTAGESIEEAVARADFGEIWDVLLSLQDQDEVLADLIRNVGEQKGRGKGLDDSGFADIIDFGGPCLSIETLRAAVSTRCLEGLYASWDSWLGRLKSFKERFGHCNVETGWEEDPALAAWVSSQRNSRAKGTLGDNRYRSLDEIGFVWDWQKVRAEENWKQMFKELELYNDIHGNPHVPRTYTNHKLAQWVWIQRGRKKGKNKDGPLTSQQIELLNKLKFRWNAHEDKWQEAYNKLKQLLIEPPQHQFSITERNDTDIAKWVENQRNLSAKGELSPDRKALLDSIGFDWVGGPGLTELKWTEMYQRLSQYRIEHGDANVPYHWKENARLANWVSAQREGRRKGILSEERIRLLDELGFAWKSREVGTWEDRLAEVAAFKATHGHCDIPVSYPNNPKLGRFVNSMRTKKNSGILSADRVKKLDAVGFHWGRQSSEETVGINLEWKRRFNELIAYKQLNGDCDVPAKWRENPALANWISNQRQQRKRGQLHPERVRLLNENGFIW